MFLDYRTKLPSVTDAYREVETLFVNGENHKAFEKAVELRATYGVECAEDAILCANVAQSCGQIEHARAILRLAASRWANNIPLQIAWTDATSELGRHLTAIDRINSLFRLATPEHYNLVHAVSTLTYARAGMSAKSRDTIQTFFTSTDVLDPYTEMLLAKANMVMREPGLALIQISRYLESLPKSGEGIIIRAQALLQLNRTSEALESINKCFELGFRDARLESFAANLWFSLGDFGSSYALLRGMKKRWPASRLLESASKLSNLAEEMANSSGESRLVTTSFSVLPLTQEPMDPTSELIRYAHLIPADLRFPDYSANDPSKIDKLKRSLIAAGYRNSAFHASLENMIALIQNGQPALGVRAGEVWTILGYAKGSEVFIARRGTAIELDTLPFSELSAAFATTNSAMLYISSPNKQNEQKRTALRRPPRILDTATPSLSSTADDELGNFNIRRTFFTVQTQKEIDSENWELALVLSASLLNSGLVSALMWLKRARILGELGRFGDADRYQELALSMEDCYEGFAFEKYQVRAKSRSPVEKRAMISQLNVQFPNSYLLRNEYSKTLLHNSNGLDYEAAERLTIETHPSSAEPILRLINWYRRQNRLDLCADLTIPNDVPAVDKIESISGVYLTSFGYKLAKQVVDTFRDGSRKDFQAALEEMLPKRTFALSATDIRYFLRAIEGEILPPAITTALAKWLHKQSQDQFMSAEYRLKLLELSWADGNLINAETRLLSFTRENPDSLTALLRLGRLYFEMQKLDKAAGTLTKLVATDPANRPALDLLARIYRQEGNLDKLFEIQTAQVAISPYDSTVITSYLETAIARKGWFQGYQAASRVKSRLPGEVILGIKLDILTRFSKFRFAGKIEDALRKTQITSLSTAIAVTKYNRIQSSPDEVQSLVEEFLTKWSGDHTLNLVKAELLCQKDKKAAVQFLESIFIIGIISADLTQLYLSLIINKGETAVKVIQTLNENFQLLFARHAVVPLMKTTREQELITFVSWCYKKLKHDVEFKIYLIRTLFRGGHSEKERIALYIANQLFLLDPENPEYNELKGMCLTDENPVEAIDYLAHAFRMTGTMSSLRYLTQAHIEADRTEEAINFTWLILLHEPLNLWAMTMATLLELEGQKRKKRFERVLPYFQVAIGLRLGHDEPMFNLAAAVAGIRSERPLPSNWLDSAIIRYDDLLGTDGDSDERRDLKAAIYAWMTKLGCGDQAKMYKPSLWQKTTSEFLARVAWIPAEENPGLEIADLGIAKYRTEDCKGAIEILSIAISQDPDNSRLYNYRGLAYLDSNNNELALRDLEIAVKLGSVDPRVFYSIGTIFAASGHEALAITYLTKAVSINPSFYLGFLKRADICRTQGNFSAALNDYNECLAIRDNEWVAILGRAEARMGLGDFEIAEQDIERALDFSPNDPATLELLAECKRQLNRSEQALDIVDRLLLFEPWNVRYLVLQSQVLLDQGLEDGAIQALQRALQQDPINSPIQRQLGALLTSKAHGDLHNFSLGLRLLKKASRATGDSDPICLSALAAAYYCSGILSEALALQEKAIGLVDKTKEPKRWNTYNSLLQKYDGRPQKKRAS
jgi:tetratricopeptide (TPR) repeat protein